MKASHDRLVIRLPEGIELSHSLAGPVSRGAAFIIDLCAIGLLTSLAGYLASLVNVLNRDVGGALYILSYFAISVGYGIACEYWWSGQTLGKWLLGLQVVDLSGLELQFSQVAVRNVLRLIDMLPVFGLAGAATIFLNRRRQRLGDIAACTVVIRRVRLGLPSMQALAYGRYNTLRSYQVTCAKFRQKASAELVATATQALLRRDELDASARLLVFDEISAQVKALVEFPESEIESLSSEQFVRNAIEVLRIPASGLSLAPTLKRISSDPMSHT